MQPDEDDKKLVAQLGHFKKLRKVAELLSFLHHSGCGRDKASNRELHFDDYVLLVLLWMFNPMIDSLRTLLRVASLPEVQKKLGVRRCSLGSFSESCRVFDPALLKQVVEQLASDLLPVGRQELFKDLPGILTLVDGTALRTLRSVVEAMWLPGTDGKDEHRTHAWKLHLHFEVDRHIPTHWDLTDARGEADSDEKSVLRKRLAPGHTYVTDRGYAQFTLFNDINRIGSSYVCRLKDNTVAEVVSQRPLSKKDIDAGVISDQIVRLGNGSKPAARPDHLIRLVCVRCTPHRKRGKTAGGTSGPPSDGILRIATNLMELPAHVIGFLYEYRWTLEVFIRFFKQVLGCRHLLSTKREGIEIQIYAAIICCMLINIMTGRKPNKWMLTLMSLYLGGWANEEDVLRELNRPDNTGVKKRAKDELWKKLGVE
ncbi:MAG TPA: IS4 family transposase [Bryobacteraceae bacterium]|nr:IS4 family transposase [Bryobacteraceae bacterium]